MNILNFKWLAAMNSLLFPCYANESALLDTQSAKIQAFYGVDTTIVPPPASFNKTGSIFAFDKKNKIELVCGPRAALGPEYIAERVALPSLFLEGIVSLQIDRVKSENITDHQIVMANPTPECLEAVRFRKDAGANLTMVSRVVWGTTTREDHQSDEVIGISLDGYLVDLLLSSN